MTSENRRKYEAVIFDLGGTLSRSSAWDEYRNAARKIAEVCSAPVDEFVEAWFARSVGLGIGLFASYGDYIRHICEYIHLEVPEKSIDAAAGIPISVTRRQLTEPREGAIEVLSFLKSNGYKTGLISDCGPDVPAVWEDTPFAPLIDVAVFSCVEGMNKGDPRIFQIALERLAVRPEACVYVADGMRNELANAAGLGMKAVQIYVPEEVDDSPIREDWHGPVITSLQEIHNFL